MSGRVAGRDPMRTGRSPLLAPLLCCLLAGLFPAELPAGGTAAGANKDKQQKLEDVRRKIKELRSSLEGARDQQSQLRDELRATEVRIGEISRSLRRLAADQKAKADTLRGLRDRRAEVQASLAQQRRLLEQQIVAAYMMGRQGQLKIIFNQQDPAMLGRMFTYYDYLNRARVDRMAEIDRRLQEVTTLEQAIARESEELERLRADQNAQMQELAETRASRRQILVKLGADIHTKEQQLASLMRDERGLAELVSRLQEALRDLPPAADLPDNAPFSSLKGRLPWPVQGKIAARFGASRKAESLTWRGVLIGAEEGREVRSIYNGRVVFADWMRGFGLLVIVDHGNGYMSLYGHNQSLYKDVGETVRRGEVIATVGSSGGSETPGLYFEIRHNGVPDNPVQWCRGGVR